MPSPKLQKTAAHHLHFGERLLTLFVFMLLAGLVVGCGGSNHDPAAPVTGGGSSGGGSSAPALTPSNTLYALQPADAFFLPATPAYLLQYPKSATGTQNPTSEITSQNQVLFGQVAMDSSGNLFVSAQVAGHPEQTSIVEYAFGATGTATPTTTIPTPEPGLSAFNVGLDNKLYLTAGNQIWVLQHGQLVRSIQSPTQDLTSADSFDNARSLAADSTGTLYVVNGDPLAQGANPVLIYDAGANGKTLPSAELAGDKTGFTTASAIALDHAGTIYLGTSSSVLVFAAGSTGNVAPIRTIAGASTGIAGMLDLKVDSTGTVFVLTGDLARGTRVLAFAPTANGNVAPVATLNTPPGQDNVKLTWSGIAVL